MAAEIRGSSEDPQQTCALQKPPRRDSQSGQQRPATPTSMIGKPTKRAKGKLCTTRVSGLDSTQSPPAGMKRADASCAFPNAFL